MNWGPVRKLISRGGSLYARAIFGVPVRDLTGGFKCFRRAVLESIDLDGVSAQGYGFQIEMTYRNVKHGFRVVEVPIVFVDRRVGQSKMSKRIFVEALTLVWKLRLGDADGAVRSLAVYRRGQVASLDRRCAHRRGRRPRVGVRSRLSLRRLRLRGDAHPSTACPSRWPSTRSARALGGGHLSCAAAA